VDANGLGEGFDSYGSVMPIEKAIEMSKEMTRANSKLSIVVFKNSI
jgi:hypothetical protein